MALAPRVLVVVQAGGQGSRMDVLTRERAKPMLRYAGTHRLVDFPLSAAVAAGVGDVWLSVQYRAGSLHGHVAGGRPWDLDRTRGGLRWLVPEEGGGPPAQEGFARGNADDLLQFVDAVRVADPDVLVVMSADQVLGVDVAALVDEHLAAEADCTVVTTSTTVTTARRKTVVVADDAGRVTALEDEPEHPSSTTIAAEVFAYRLSSVVEALETLRREAGETGDAEGALGDYPDALLPLLVREGRTRAVSLGGYWADAGTPASYLRAHRDLLAGRVDVFDHPDRPVLTRPPVGPPARVRSGAEVEDSLLSPRCDVGGTVRRSVLGPGAVVEAGALVEDAVLLDDVLVARGARVTTAVLDERVTVRRGAVVGGPAPRGRLDDVHVTLVGRECRVSGGVVVEAGGRLEPGTVA